MTTGLLSFGRTSSNGGKSQVNMDGLQDGGGDPFANRMKGSQAWGWVDGNLTDALTPDLFDSDGWPIASSLFTTHGGVSTGHVFIPTTAELPGNWILKWDGTGTVGITVGTGSGALTTVSGGATSSPWVLSVPSTVLSFNVKITVAGPRNLRLYNANDNDPDVNQFTQKLLSRLQQAAFSSIRFLNWQNGNTCNVATWDTGNRPVTYWTYTAGQKRADLLCNLAGSGITSNSGGDYTVTAPTTWTGTPGQDPPDKCTVHVVWNASSPTRTTVTFTGSGSATINWTGNALTVGNQVYFSNSGGATPTEIFAQTVANVPYFPITDTGGTHSALYYVVVANTNDIQISATKGGSAITFATAGTGTTTGRSLPSLAVGGTNPKPLLSVEGHPPSPGDFGYPVGGAGNSSLNTLVYDATIGGWLGTNSGGSTLNNAVPIAVMVQLCQAVGSNPWFISPCMACTPMTDWHTQLATYLKNNSPNWMVPIIEGPNETWNSAGGFQQTIYVWAITFAYGWSLASAGFGDTNNWYGRAMSTIGQAFNAVYGGSVDGTKYQVVCATQEASNVVPTDNNTRLTSTKYLLQTPQVGYTATPAHNWVTTVAHAAYINPWQYGYNQEIPLAYDYYVTNSGNAAAQAADAATYASGLLGGGIATVSGSTVTLNNHGFVANQIVVPLIVQGSVIPSPLVNNSGFFVLSSGLTTNAFQVATTEGGSALTFSGGSGTLYFCPTTVAVPNIAAQSVMDQNLAIWAASIGTGSKVTRQSRYEGGYAPSYNNAAVTAEVTAATNANPMVLTLGLTNNQGIHGAKPTDQITSAVAGMFFKISGITDPNWTSLNGQTVSVASVSGNLITTTFNASALIAPFAASGGNGTATYFLDAGATQAMALALNALRLAGKSAPLLQNYLTTDYNNLKNISVVGSSTTITGQSPSMFSLAGAPNGALGPTNLGNNIWSVLEDLYVSPDPPQWKAAIAFNN